MAVLLLCVVLQVTAECDGGDASSVGCCVSAFVRAGKACAVI
jgi:hypothetical protein